LNFQIKKANSVYEIPLVPIIQLCGTNFEIKHFVCYSLTKYFSTSRYSAFEGEYQDNITLDDNKVGRKYFSCIRISNREQLIQSIKLSKTSMMMEYLKLSYMEFSAQNIMQQISELLDQLYMEMNVQLLEALKNIQVGYQEKNIWDMIHTADITTNDGREIEELTTEQLFQTYLGLLKKMQQRKPEKLLIIVENIDHLLTLSQYENVIKNIQNMVKESDVTFLFTMSVEGYVSMKDELLEGISVMNDVVFNFPEWDRLHQFICNNYPRQVVWDDASIRSGIQGIVHNIGKENMRLHLQENVFLKLLQDSLCIKMAVKTGINSVENAFLLNETVL